MTNPNLASTWSYTQIVVAVDESELSRKAFAQALAIAQAFQAQLNLIHVISSLQEEYQDLSSLTLSGGYYPAVTDESLQERWQNLEEEGLELLRSLTKIAIDQGVSTEFTQIVGQAEQKICEFAQRLNADLIVLGSHGRTGLSELFLGSVSNYVSHHVPCAVLIVHQAEDES